MAAVLHNICILAPDINPRTLMPSNTVPRYHRSNALINAGVDIKKWGTAEHVRVANDALATSEVSHRSLQHRCSTIIRYNVFDGELCTHHLKLHCNCVSFSRHGSNTDAAVLQGRDPTIDRRISESIHCSLRHIGEGDFQWVDILMTPSKLTLKF